MARISGFWLAFLAVVVIGISIGAAPAQAHVSEQGLVLLLPTGHYIWAGVLSVVASVLLISVTPKALVERMFRPLRFGGPLMPRWVAEATSLVSLAVFAGLIYIGITGPRDPLTNLLPLVIWVGFWVILFSAVGVLGNLWRFLNPWTGLAALLLGRDKPGAVTLPDRIGAAPALVIFLLFAAFYVADPAPTDPDRLAVIALLYWVFTLAAMALFGAEVWLARGEMFTVLFGLIARVSPFGTGPDRALGVPGWNLSPTSAVPVTLGLLSIAVLGVGSFDGLKETFWWLGRIGVNPLEFPGRSFVIGSSLAGLLGASVGLAAVFTLTLWAGERLSRLGQSGVPEVSVAELLRRFAPTLLPIALSYHVSHFFVTFLVDGQYLLAAIGDPLANGSNFLGLGQIRVTTGFLNTADSVKRIWLTQASIVVVGHILAILVSHHVALSLFKTQKRAAISQIPIASFMIAYTFFGLWLLAAPRGI